MQHVAAAAHNKAKTENVEVQRRKQMLFDRQSDKEVLTKAKTEKSTRKCHRVPFVGTRVESKDGRFQQGEQNVPTMHTQSIGVHDLLRPQTNKSGAVMLEEHKQKRRGVLVVIAKVRFRRPGDHLLEWVYMKQ